MTPNFFQAATLKKMCVKNEPIKIWVDFTGYPSNHFSGCRLNGRMTSWWCRQFCVLSVWLSFFLLCRYLDQSCNSFISVSVRRFQSTRRCSRFQCAAVLHCSHPCHSPSDVKEEAGLLWQRWTWRYSCSKIRVWSNPCWALVQLRTAFFASSLWKNYCSLLNPILPPLLQLHTYYYCYYFVPIIYLC